jgi:hypothetical protein
MNIHEIIAEMCDQMMASVHDHKFLEIYMNDKIS